MEPSENQDGSLGAEVCVWMGGRRGGMERANMDAVVAYSKRKERFAIEDRIYSVCVVLSYYA